MKVLQITLTTVYPPSRGGELRDHGLVKSFPEEGDEVVRYCCGGLLTNHNIPNINRRIEIDDGYLEFRPINPIYDTPSVLQLITGINGFFSEKLFELSFPSSLDEWMTWADIIIVEDPFLVPSISKRSDRTPVIYSSHNVESDRLSHSNRILSNWYDQYLFDLEREAINQAAGLIHSSEEDGKTFEKKFDFTTPKFYAPNGVFKSEISDSSQQDSPGIRDDLGISEESLVGIFIGSNYGPNIKAVQHLPRIAESVNQKFEFDIVIVGNVSSSLSPEDCIHPVGFVDDTDPYYNLADFALNPVVDGGGTNIKMIEYMAKGLPIVTTKFGTRGFSISNFQEIFIGSIREFPDMIYNLNNLETSDLGERTREYVRDNFTWENISKQLRRQLISELDIT